MSKTSLSPSQRSAAEWAQIVEQSKTTKHSLRAFSVETGVPLRHLYHWRSKLKASVPRREGGFSQIKPQLVTPENAPERGAVELHLRSGHMVRFTGGQADPSLLRTIIEVVEGGGAC